MHYDVEIGKYFSISQGVAIGAGGRAENSGCPMVEDIVYIGPGAKIFRRIIGNNVSIGANAVVTKSLPDNAVVAAVTTNIISYEGSSSLINIHQ